MLKGVVSVVPGYAGGGLQARGEKPTYEEVSSGKTGHAEVIKIEYNPELISYDTLLTVFFATHDPTTLNRQGADVGTQYRSIILYANEAQKKDAEKFIVMLDQSSQEGGKITTEVQPLGDFFEAEEYHKDYFAKNPLQPYCQVVINPKLRKVQEKFATLLNDNDSG